MDYPEIIDACETVTDRAKDYQYLQWIAFETLTRTGCREGEVVQIGRWTLNNLGIYELKTEKGNAVRTFDAVVLPIEFREWIANRPSGIAPTSVDRLRGAFRQMNKYGQLTTGNKGISTHLFRYAYIRTLQKAGKTVPEIMAIMGLSQAKTVNGYLNNLINYT